MRRIGNLASIASVLTIFMVLLAACGGSSTTKAAAVTVGLVTDVGGLNDGGFNQFSHAGYEKARQQYGFPDVVIQSQVISDNEYLKNITAAAQQADMVIGVGFLMQNAMDRVARQFPNKKFALIDGCPTQTSGGNCDPLPNVAPLFFKEQEAGCLVGAIAGQMEVDGKSKVCGKEHLWTQSYYVGTAGAVSAETIRRYISVCQGK
jgi:basic membrane protein A and related proteins